MDVSFYAQLTRQFINIGAQILCGVIIWLTLQYLLGLLIYTVPIIPLTGLIIRVYIGIYRQIALTKILFYNSHLQLTN